MRPMTPQGPSEAAAAPGRPDFTIVSLAAVTWDFRLVGRTRMLSEAWRDLGQPTVFVQVPSYRTALQRLVAPLRPRPAVPVLRPWPAHPARWWARLDAADLERAIRGRARSLRRALGRRVAWERAVAVVVSPVWTPWLDELPFARVVYDCIDELAVHMKRPELAPLYRAWEDRLLQRATGAVVTAAGLGRGLRARRPDLPVALIRNGVDAERFERGAAEGPRPADVPAAGRPVVGFVGALYEWIDWGLIEEVARALPELDFVLVGPHDRRGAVRRLAGLRNVHLLGPRPYGRVPAYIAAFDVCWVPFRQDAVGLAANPVKVYEYLALGKPVVSTPVADVESFGALLAVARTPAEMVGKLRAALQQAPGAAEARRAFARQNTWRARAAAYVEFLATLWT